MPKTTSRNPSPDKPTTRNAYNCPTRITPAAPARVSNHTTPNSMTRKSAAPSHRSSPDNSKHATGPPTRP